MIISAWWLRTSSKFLGLNSKKSAETLEHWKLLSTNRFLQITQSSYLNKSVWIVLQLAYDVVRWQEKKILWFHVDKISRFIRNRQKVPVLDCFSSISSAFSKIQHTITLLNWRSVFGNDIYAYFSLEPSSLPIVVAKDGKRLANTTKKWFLALVWFNTSNRRKLLCSLFVFLCFLVHRHERWNTMF